MFSKQNTDRLRILGCASLLAGYIFILNDNQKVGLPLSLFGNIAMVPFAVKNKLHDVTMLQSAFAAVTASALLL